VLLAALAGIGCSQGDPAKAYEFVIRVHADPGRPIAGAIISHQGARVAESNAEGVVHLAIRGQEGTVKSFDIACPPAHRPPAEPLSLALRSVSEAGKRPEYVVACTPTKRDIVVAVRANQGTDIPLIHWGKEVARTDASGAAHALLSVIPGDPIELTLDTTGRPELRPQNPLARFQAPNHEDVLVLNQDFTVLRSKRGPGRPKGPVRITTR
jgi:hypothetical protein